MEESKYNGFKLISLTLKNDKVFGDIEYNFIEEDDKFDEIYTTVIIGSNGTRKSLLFKRIITLFWDLSILRNEEKKKIEYDFWFSLKYSLSGLTYEYTNIHKFEEGGIFKKEIYFVIDNIIQRDEEKRYTFEQAFPPDSIIAVTAIIPDKFPFPNPEKFPQYKYIGSRYRPQLAGTSTFINRTVNYIADSVGNIPFIDAINNLLKEFFNPEYDPYFTFYTQNTPLFFSDNLSIDMFNQFFEKIDERYKETGKTPPFKLGYYKSNVKGNTELITKLIAFCLKFKNEGRLRGFPRSSKKAISYKINDEIGLNNLKADIDIVNHLRGLGIIQTPILEFLKLNDNALEGYSVLDSSSGEHNLFGSMIGLMASVKPESLILIDEPEISLHPNWQMKYLNFIRKLFENEIYSKSHILVASHSHFLISDLKGDNSKIIGLTRQPHLKLINFKKNIDTFGWSTDEVLYKIFKLRTTRNHFFEYDLTEMISLVEKESNDKLHIQMLVDKLEKFSFSPEDPINILIEKTKEYLVKI